MKTDRPNCPNCGAPIKGALCDYCGTVFYDFANIDLHADSYIRMKIDNELFIFKAQTEHIQIDAKQRERILYADDSIFERINAPDYFVEVSFHVIPDEKGILLARARKEEES